MIPNFNWDAGLFVCVTLLLNASIILLLLSVIVEICVFLLVLPAIPRQSIRNDVKIMINQKKLNKGCLKR